jgi:hypothetical protein
MCYRMSAPKTKAGKLLGSLSETTVDEWDQLLVKLSQDWMFAYTNRQMRAMLEGNTSPPPEPPKVQPSSAVKDAGGEAALPQVAHKGETAGGTVESLVRCYREDSRSPYHSLRWRTRANYEGLLRRILDSCGEARLADLSADKIDEFHASWSERGAKKAMGHSLVTMFRGLVSFGATVLEDAECERLSGAMRRLKMDYSAPRSSQMTAEHAEAVRDMAHKKGVPSIALAQAFQFDCKLAQADVIGEWVPLSEPGSSEIISRDKKWIRGLRWSQIDEHVILRHFSSKHQREIEVDLKLAPMVAAEFAKLDARPVSGQPIILCEATEMPWTAVGFRRRWREVATEAGVPKDVYNMDTSGGPFISVAEEKLRRAHRRVTK